MPVRRWTKKGKQVISIDLFCGMGGATQGMLSAGAKVVLSVDGWEVAEYLHKLNYPDVPFERRMLGEDPDADLELLKKHLPNDLHNYHFHLHGSPPCQAFSGIAGNKRRPLSEGTKNVDYFLWLVEQLKPDSWSMENVPATRKHYPHLPHEMLRAMDFGVPQRRRRFFAGEGWKTTPRSGTVVAWDEVIDANGATALNTVGCSISNSERARRSDSPLGEVSKTITRQQPTLRQEQPDGTFVVVGYVGSEDTAKLFGFPDGMDFSRGDYSISDIRIAIGNSVAPPVMKAVIDGILK